MAAGVLQVRLAGLIATSREWVIEEDTECFLLLGLGGDDLVFDLVVRRLREDALGD
jgi:hypothetical protein